MVLAATLIVAAIGTAIVSGLSAYRFLPALGITVFALLVATWASTAGAFLA